MLAAMVITVIVFTACSRYASQFNDPTLIVAFAERMQTTLDLGIP